MRDYDVVIVGGGMVGVSLACALGKLPIKVALIEAFSLQSNEQPHYDDRVIALARGAKPIFGKIGVWSHMAKYATPIHHIHVSQKHAWGTTHLDRADIFADALGYVIPARDIGHALAAVLPTRVNVETYTPATLTQFDCTPNRVNLEIEVKGENQSLTSKVLLAADGAQSMIRARMGWRVSRHDYAQHAIICNVTFSEPHQYVAYERFDTKGPLALLPLSEKRMAVIWSMDNRLTDEILTLSDDAFKQRLQQQFGYRLGLVERVGRRSHYPLLALQAKQFVGQRVALIGNAAHSMHPVAGQGFNLGLRDIQVLTKLVAQTVESGDDVGGDVLLQQYAKLQSNDHRWVMAMTHSLIQIFSLPSLPARWMRSLAMVGLDLSPWLKNPAALHAMGLLRRSA